MWTRPIARTRDSLPRAFERAPWPILTKHRARAGRSFCGGFFQIGDRHEETNIHRAAAAALLTGISVASAVTTHNATMARLARDALNLTSAQQKTAWNDLFTGALNQKTPSGFNATIGAVVLYSVTSAPVTAKAASDVPVLKPYKFAMVSGSCDDRSNRSEDRGSHYPINGSRRAIRAAASDAVRSHLCCFGWLGWPL